ncbi:MAG TPA: HEAT repeat domain-containing protein [Fimbriimonadaceae bacterium]|nr:HEAT repeat domain-containing protein [Fimbriimonadaceae bacterium]
MKRALLVLLLACSCLAAAQLTSAERKGIQDALFVGNMTQKDLEYDRRPFNDKYRLPLINLAIDKPLDAADKLMAFHKSGGTKSLAALIKAARTQGLNDPPAITIVNSSYKNDRELRPLPQPLRAPVKKLADSVSDANAIVKKAISALTPEETRYLIETLPLYANEDSSITFAFTKRTTYDAKRILALLDKVDLVAIRSAAEMLAQNVEAVKPELQAVAKVVMKPLDLKLRINNLRVDVCGLEDNVHTDTDAVLTIDLGGNDIYRGRCGAGISYASVLVDLGGNDTFDCPDLNCGAGVLGVGLVYDYGGNDVFRTRSLALGCGIAGVGGFFREGGNDSYQSVSLAQGYGEFGLGIMCDTAGADRYDGGYNVQGAARTEGVGWLVDQSGDDVYKAGGLILNSPLFEKVHYSNGQGYASGYREDTGGTSGGIGLLTDLGGHDTYLGETYCQAASYWFSIGSLYDAGGNDTYTAYHYAQASAMHMTAAYLFDLGGDDAYICKFGACHAIGHDYGVAFLLDRSGMDLYAAHDSRPATGSANGLAIFVDAEGDDRYFGPPAAGLSARGTGSLAVFCDLGGADTYAEGLANGEATSKETWAVAYDAESGPVGKAATPANAGGGTPPTPGSIQMPDDAAMEQIYAKATQWGVGTAQQEVHDNVAKLIGIGKPALAWMIDKHLATADRLQIRAFVAVVGGLGADGRQMIAPKVAADNVDEARVALSICSDGNVKEAAPYLPVALKKPDLQRAAARAAGALGSKEAIDDLMALTLSPDHLTALSALTSLIALADPSTVGTAQALLSSPELPMRKGAIQLIDKFPAQALPIAKGLLGSSDPQMARIGIEILGNVGTPEALDLIGKMLTGGSASGVRIQALLALNGRVPESFRGAVIDARKDSDPLVRAVAMGTDLGR